MELYIEMLGANRRILNNMTHQIVENLSSHVLGMNNGNRRTDLLYAIPGDLQLVVATIALPSWTFGLDHK